MNLSALTSPETYLTAKGKKISAPKTYRQYLESAGKTDPANAYAAALKAAVPTGITPAEKSAALGLSRSGYRDYLTAKQSRRLAGEKATAADAYASGVQAAASSYKDYLTSYQKTQNDRVRSVVNSLKNAGTLDYEDAYRYALSGGLTPNAADTAAREGIAQAENKLRVSALRTVVSRSLNPSRARAFAASLGLSEKTVSQIGDFAEAYARATAQGEDLSDLYEQYLSTHEQK